MALYFQNMFSGTIWIAFLYYDPASPCQPPLVKQGWWAVPSGQSFNAWNTDLENVGPAAFYAEEFKDSGGATWSGTGNNWYQIKDGGFSQCYSDNSGCDQQPDFVPLDFQGYCDVTVILGPAPGATQIIYAPCVPMLTAYPSTQAPNFYTTVSYTGTGFPSNISVYLFLVGIQGRSAPLAAGFQNTDANGNFSGAYSFICGDAAPSANVVLEAWNEANTLLLASATPISLGCSP
jgi:hypothetical protein